MTDKKRPWGKWFWSDWRADASLRRCGYAARGLWADMLSLMATETDLFGYLIMDGQPLEASDLAGLLGGSEREVRKLLAELEARRVFSRTGPQDLEDLVASDIPSGVIFSRRMLRDQAKAELDRVNGGKGGNPSLKGSDQKSAETDNAGVNHPDKAQSQKPESEPETRKDTSLRSATPAKTAIPIPDWIPKEAWTAFLEMRSKVRAKPTDRAILLLIAELRKLRAAGEDVGGILDQSTMNNWKGVFPVKHRSNGGKNDGQSSYGSFGSTVAGVVHARNSGGLFATGGPEVVEPSGPADQAGTGGEIIDLRARSQA